MRLFDYEDIHDFGEVTRPFIPFYIWGHTDEVPLISLMSRKHTMVENFGEEDMPSKSLEISIRYVTLKERLNQRRDAAKKQLDELDAAIDALEKNPQFEEMLNVLGKVTRI